MGTQNSVASQNGVYVQTEGASGFLCKLAEKAEHLVRAVVVAVKLAGAFHGVGAALLDALIDSAAALGVSTLRLDTCRFMHDAHSLYRSRGFVERPPCAESGIPAHLHEFWIFFEGPR